MPADKSPSRSGYARLCLGECPRLIFSWRCRVENNDYQVLDGRDRAALGIDFEIVLSRSIDFRRTFCHRADTNFFACKIGAVQHARRFSLGVKPQQSRQPRRWLRYWCPPGIHRDVHLGEQALSSMSRRPNLFANVQARGAFVASPSPINNGAVHFAPLQRFDAWTSTRLIRFVALAESHGAAAARAPFSTTPEFQAERSSCILQSL